MSDYQDLWKQQRERRAFLALADGTVFHGYAFGDPHDRTGEAVFNTGMTGYQEIISDPSYAGHSRNGCSYLELAEFIMRYGAEPERDLRELWRRIVFSIAVSNTDDHLRNHGFLLANAGWRLSPAYDINPEPERHGLSLNISESDNTLDFFLALQVAPDFRLSVGEAESILKKTTGVVSRWKTYANAVGIPRSEQEMMQTAFRY